ncbi:MAG: HAD family phosphatase [Granulosicoccus sp.]|nr:HAD family phosphatase [Granulosicoccus sp.]
MIALWDLGNVVVRWEPEEILQKLNYTAEQTDYVRSELLGHPDWLALDRGTTTEAVVAERLVDESGLSMDQALRCFDVVRESLTDLPQSIELLHQMKRAGISQYVLSNMSAVNADYLRRRDYFGLFDGVMISAEEKLIKPEVDIFKTVLERFQLDPAETFFIDDSKPNIDVAQSLGINALHFHRSDACYQSVRDAFKLS